MNLTKTGESAKEIIFETDSSETEIREKINSLISKGTQQKNPFYYLRNPSVLFKKVNYFQFSVKPDHIYIRRGFNAPAFYIYFEKGATKTKLQFQASYLSLTVFVSLLFFAIGSYTCYQQYGKSGFDKETLLIIALYLILWIFVTVALLGMDKWRSYFFKRTVKMIVEDLKS